MTLIDIVQAAPTGASYVVIGTDGTLTAERVLTGTANQIVVTDGGAGAAVTLSTPQDIHTGASPTFVGLTLSGMTAGSVLFAGVSGALTQDNANFFFNNTTDALGIGHAVPLVRFHAVTQTAAVGFLHDVYQEGLQGAGFIGRKARGTLADARRAQALDPLAIYQARGAFAVDDATTAAFASTNSGLFQFFAAEAFTSTTRGAYWSVSVAPIGSTTAAEGVRLSDVGNVKIGNGAGASVVRGTTEGTAHLDIFNGTAPAGTLTNGISLYSAAGELNVMDAAGNNTLLSPHDDMTNEWIFLSKQTVTGKVLRIDMERMMRKLDAILGGGFIREW